MQISMQPRTVDKKVIEAELVTEAKFINELFSKIAFPERLDEDKQSEDGVSNASKNGISGIRPSRARSLSELQKRLEIIQSKAKKKQSYKEKLAKRSLKKRLRKKAKLNQRNAAIKQRVAKAPSGLEKPSDSAESKPSNKPVFNSEGKMVFSKFDFSGLGEKQKEKKKIKDPKRILENLKRQKEKLEKLEAEGEGEKVKAIREKKKWNTAMAKTEGEKIKDDPELVKKTMKRNELKKKKSAKKWEQRIENIEKGKLDRQNKRQENIDKRRLDKKTKKLKNAAKKGKIVPGF